MSQSLGDLSRKTLSSPSIRCKLNNATLASKMVHCNMLVEHATCSSAIDRQGTIVRLQWSASHLNLKKLVNDY